MTQQYLSEIRMMAFNFAPKGWALCNGQTLSIQQNAALFSLLGTSYGGNGTTTFNLPNLQGQVPLHAGTGPSGAGYVLGQAGGEINHTLSMGEMPQHVHTLRAKAAQAPAAAADVIPGPTMALAEPVASVGTTAVPLNIYSTTLSSQIMAPNAVGMDGGGQPHPNQQPYQVLNFCIALSGIFPSRS